MKVVMASPTKQLKIESRYPMMVALLALLMKICTKFVIEISAMAHPISKTQNTVTLVSTNIVSSRKYLPKP